MFLAVGPQPPAQPTPLPPALARLGIRPPALPAGWRGVMTVRINGDAPITVPLGEQATVGLPLGAGAGAGPGGVADLMDLLRRLIGQGRVTRTPMARPAAPAWQPGAVPAGRPAGGEATADRPSQVKRLLALVNQERAKVGAGPLTLDPKLVQAAQGHSDDMAKRGYFGHDTPEGKKFYQRAGEAGTFAGAENIAGGQRTPEGALAAWLNSPGPRKNLLNPAWTRMGAGVEGGRWTQMFG